MISTMKETAYEDGKQKVCAWIILYEWRFRKDLSEKMILKPRFKG